MGAVGLTGTKAKNSSGKMVDAFNITIGGEQGANNKIGELKYKGVVVDDLKDRLKDILIENYSAKLKKETSEELIGKLIKSSQAP